MKTKKPTRPRCNANRAYLSTARDVDIVANFERTSTVAALIVGLAFGLCLFFGLVM